MDVSRQFVRMCRHAKGLQIDWIPKNGDWLYVGARDTCSPIILTGYSGIPKWTDSANFYDLPDETELYGIVWLPRQDQIQKLIRQEYNQPYLSMAEQFMEFSLKYEVDVDLGFEQRWLRFYMFLTEFKLWVDGKWTGRNKREATV